MSTKLTEQQEVLFRHVHPDFYDAEKKEPSSSRFMPSKLDKNMLSVDRSSMVGPESAHANFTQDGKKCAAVFGVSVGEFAAENIDCISDPVPETETTRKNDAHALADYNVFDKAAQKLIAKRLQRLAIQRGVFYVAAQN